MGPGGGGARGGVQLSSKTITTEVCRHAFCVCVGRQLQGGQHSVLQTLYTRLSAAGLQSPLYFL